VDAWHEGWSERDRVTLIDMLRMDTIDEARLKNCHDYGYLVRKDALYRNIALRFDEEV
jgi:hypothetical protein